MADKIDTRAPPRDYGTGTGAGNETHVHQGTTPPVATRSSNAMAYIVGGVVVGLIILYMLFGGFASNDPTPTSTAPAGSSSVIDDGAGTGAAGTGTTGTGAEGTGTVGTAPADDGAATAPAGSDAGTGTGTAPAPAD